MATNSQGKYPLDVLQRMLDDALVQTGKALRASRKDAAKDGTSQGSLQARLPDTIRTFHGALDDIEVQITRAKAVLARDLSRFQNQAATVEDPQPINAQSKEPVAMDVKPSPPANPSTAANAEVKAEGPQPQPPPVAPMPEMGAAPVASMDVDAPPPPPPPPALQVPPKQDVPKEQPQQMGAPPAPMDMPGEPLQGPNAVKQANAAPSANDPGAGLNFTNMQFTLVPANEDTQNQGAEQDSSTFNPPDGDDLLDGLLPDDIDPVSDLRQNNEPSSIQDSNMADANANGNGSMGNNADTAMMDTALDDILGLDLANADGTDFDFGLEGGSFNDLINSHDINTDDNNMATQSGDFDSIFGLDNMGGAS